MRVAGVDVGARRKGFHVAVLEDDSLVARPLRVPDASGVIAFLRPYEPVVVAVDSPISCAPVGERSRECERQLARSVCSLRYTPDVASVTRNSYYAWIRNGLALYDALRRAELRAIECFPTASWTCWAGRRAGVSRGAWSAAALARLGLVGVPGRLGQDGRDAIGAALTARAFVRNEFECFGEIVVPR